MIHIAYIKYITTDTYIRIGTQYIMKIRFSFIFYARIIPSRNTYKHIIYMVNHIFRQHNNYII